MKSEMQSKVMWFLILLVHTTLVSVAAGAVTTALPPTPSSGPPSATSHEPTPSYAYKTAPPVFTADNARHTTHAPPPSSTHARTRQIHKQPKQPKYKQPDYYDVDAGINPDGPTIASVENSFVNDVPFIEHRAGRGQQGQEDGVDVKDVDNGGFVVPVDFSSILSELDKVSGGKDARDILRNPFVGEKRNKNRDGFPEFFNEAESKDSVFEPNFGSLASSASDQKTRKVKEEDEEGFVDPNVQFRSLFDSTETADGFRPSDFLEYQGDTQGDTADADLSKSSQSRAYPQFTYTGRDGDDSDGEQEEEEDEVYAELNNPRYRSSYRQVDSRKRDPYDDSNYYSGERDRSPAPPAPPPPKYKVGGGGSGSGSGGGKAKAASTTEETSHSPQSGGGGSKGDSPGKNKCKKVEKLVEENEEYDSYTEPEEGYDPSTYTSRYRRQASGGRRQAREKGNKKRPMTCYVCEDEEGRYAERCSYDSKADPKQGSYFHSSSTSFNDNGNKGRRGGRGGRGGGSEGGDRYKRDPEHSAADAPAASTALEAQTSSFKDRESNESESEDAEELPKKLQKRQSSGGRYAQDYPRSPRQGSRPPPRQPGQVRGNRRQEEYEDADEEDYESPYSPYGTDANREEYGFAPSSQGRRNRGGRQNEFDIRIPTPDYAADPGIRNGDRAREEDYDEEDDYRNPESQTERGGGGGGRGRGSGSGGGGRGRSNAPDSIDFELGPGPSYGGGPSSDGGNRRAGSGGSGGRRGGSSPGGRGQQEFGFGAPQDFGRDQGEASRGFNVDFSIPKEFDPDVQLGASNSNNRPVFNNDFGPEFDNAYEEHVKQYFPEAFGGGSSTQGPERGHSPPILSSTYRPSDGPGPFSSPRPAPVYHHSNSNRGRSPTQQRHQYSPPPYFNGPQHYGPGSGNEDEIAHSNNGQLHQAVNSFGQKGNRQGCQRVQKGDMSCIVCSDPRGMKKEECMYASNDPKNHQMAYHEVSEYSSLPPVSILPSPQSSKREAKFGDRNKPVESRTIVHQESRRVEVKKSPKQKSDAAAAPIDYDFDY